MILCTVETELCKPIPIFFYVTVSAAFLVRTWTQAQVPFSNTAIGLDWGTYHHALGSVYVIVIASNIVVFYVSLADINRFTFLCWLVSHPDSHRWLLSLSLVLPEDFSPY